MLQAHEQYALIQITCNMLVLKIMPSLHTNYFNGHNNDYFYVIVWQCLTIPKDQNLRNLQATLVQLAKRGMF